MRVQTGMRDRIRTRTSHRTLSEAVSFLDHALGSVRHDPAPPRSRDQAFGHSGRAPVSAWAVLPLRPRGVAVGTCWASDRHAPAPAACRPPRPVAGTPGTSVAPPVRSEPASVPASFPSQDRPSWPGRPRGRPPRPACASCPAARLARRAHVRACTGPVRLLSSAGCWRLSGLSHGGRHGLQRGGRCRVSASGRDPVDAADLIQAVRRLLNV